MTQRNGVTGWHGLLRHRSISRTFAGFIGSIERGSLVLLWEPRGPQWTDELILDLCSELDLVHVVDPYAATSLTPEQPYYRLHGRTGFRYVYEQDELSDLLSTLPGDADSYVLFNNVRMAEDAARFGKLIIDSGERVGGGQQAL